MAGAIFIPVTNFHHVTEILAQPPVEKRWIKLGYLFCVVALCLDAFTSFFVKGVSPKLFFPYSARTGTSVSSLHRCVLLLSGAMDLSTNPGVASRIGH